MKFLSVIAASLIASASAFCPNLCSGHGKCGNLDRCACYTYSGTTRGDNVNYYEIADQRAAWTGADCSLRTCPLAFSWSGSSPNGLSTQVVVTTVTTNSIAFTVTAAQGALVSATLNNLANGQKIYYSGALWTIRSCTYASLLVTCQVYESNTHFL